MGVAKSMTLRGGGGPTLSVTMTLIFPKIVWTCPLCMIQFFFNNIKFMDTNNTDQVETPTVR